MLLPEFKLTEKDGYFAFEAKDDVTGIYQEVFIRETEAELKALAVEVLLDENNEPRVTEEGTPLYFIHPFTYKE